MLYFPRFLRPTATKYLQSKPANNCNQQEAVAFWGALTCALPFQTYVSSNIWVLLLSSFELRRDVLFCCCCMVLQFCPCYVGDYGDLASHCCIVLPIWSISLRNSYFSFTHSNFFVEGFIRIYRIKDGKLEEVHKTPVGGIPGALSAYRGRLLAGVGKALRIYDMGKKRLLRKSEYRSLPTHISSLHVLGDRIYVGDQQVSLSLL